MKTRFDNSRQWLCADGRVCTIENMETAHLMNVLNMFINSPKRTVSMLISDIESQKNSWGIIPQSDLVSASLRNVTSMSFDEIVGYSLTCPLGLAMLKELDRRGINTQNYINQIRG